jgi:hypothetical protein
MPNILTTDLRRKNIKNFIDTIQNESVYFCFSNPTPWNSESSPDNPEQTYDLTSDIFGDMLYAKRIIPSNVSFVVNNYGWVSGGRYQKFSDTEDVNALTRVRTFVRATATANLTDGTVTSYTITNGGTEYTSTPTVTISGNATGTAVVSGGSVISITPTFVGSGYGTTPPTVTIDYPSSIQLDTFDFRPYYVITDEYKIYKCLDNNGGAPSTIKPTSVSVDKTEPTALSDGYKWKYLGTISATDLERFYTANWVPIKILSSDDTSAQWDIQFNASNTTLNGALGATGALKTSTIGVTDNFGFRQNDILMIGGSELVKISGATGFIGSTGLVVTRGYSSTNGSVGATGSGASVINLSLRDYGVNIVEELNASNLMVKVRISGNEGDKIVDENEYRQISLITNPIYKRSIFLTPSSGTSNTIVLNTTHASVAEANPSLDIYPSDGKKIAILSGTGVGQVREIAASGYDNNTNTVTITKAWDTIPDNTSVYGIVSIASVANQTTILNLGTGALFLQDSIVTQATSGSSGTVVKYDILNKKLYLTSVIGEFDGSGDIVSGALNSTVTGIQYPTFESNFADVLYIENRKSITRYPDQIEDVKVIIRY